MRNEQGERDEESLSLAGCMRLYILWKHQKERVFMCVYVCCCWFFVVVVLEGGSIDDNICRESL